MTPTLKKHRTKIVLCVLLLAVIGVGGKKLYRAYEKDAEARLLMELSANVAELCIARKEKYPGSLPDSLRTCLHQNTMHATDDEFFADWKNQPAMISGVIDYMEGRRPTKKHYECSSRSGLLIKMLRSQGIESYDVISPKFQPEFNDHVVVNILDPETKEWELHDPTHDLVFRSVKTHERLSAQEMVAMGVDEFEPCLPDGSCGWDNTTDEGVHLHHVKTYWGAIVTKTPEEEWQVTYNPAHFDPQKPMGDQAYCEFRSKFCKLPPISTIELK